MSKKGKKASNKRGKNSAKSTKPQNAKQARMEPPPVPEHRVQPQEVDNPRFETGTSYPRLEQLTSAQKSEFFSRETVPGASILATYLSVDPGVSLKDLELGSRNLSRDSGAGPSTLSTDSRAGPSTLPRELSPPPRTLSPEPEEEPIDLSMNSEEEPINLSRDSGAGPSTWSRDSGAGPSNWSRDLGSDPSTYLSDPEAGPSHWSRDMGAGPSTMLSDSETGPSTWSRDSGAGPSTMSSDFGAGPSTWLIDAGAGPSTMPSDSGAGHSTWLIDSGAGLSTMPSDSGAGPSTWIRDSGAGPSTMLSDSEAGPSTWLRDSGAGPSTIVKDVTAAPTIDRDMYSDVNLKRSIVSKFLGVPKCMQPENYDSEATLNEMYKKTVLPADKDENSKSAKEDSNSAQKSETSRNLKKPGTKMKRKISPPDEPQASTSKQECQVSTSYIKKPNGDQISQISQISSSISEKACGRVQESVVSSSDAETLADSVQTCEISTADLIEIRHVQDIEREILKMDIIRESSNSSDFGKQYIQRLAASLLAGEASIVFHDYRQRAAWPKKKSRVPYVFLHPPFEFRNHIGRVLARNIQFYHPKRGTHYTKILSPSFEDQQNLAHYFDENQMPYHTFGHPSEKMTRVVIRGLTGDIDLVKLKDELIAASIPIIRLHKMRYNGMHKKRWHIILAIVPHSEEGLRILTVSKIFGQVVTMEPAKSKTKQCHRCQRWGHAQRFCRGRVKCVKCAGDHFSDQCTRNPLEELPSCANCGGDHPANYRQCFHCPDSVVYKSWQKKNKRQNQKFPWVLATPENCGMAYVRDRVDNLPVE